MIEGPFVVKRFAHVKRRMLVVAVAALLPAALGLSSTRGAAAQGSAAPHERFFRLGWEGPQRPGGQVPIPGVIYKPDFNCGEGWAPLWRVCYGACLHEVWAR